MNFSVNLIIRSLILSRFVSMFISKTESIDKFDTSSDLPKGFIVIWKKKKKEQIVNYSGNETREPQVLD